MTRLVLVPEHWDMGYMCVYYIYKIRLFGDFMGGRLSVNETKEKDYSAFMWMILCYIPHGAKGTSEKNL